MTAPVDFNSIDAAIAARKVTAAKALRLRSNCMLADIAFYLLGLACIFALFSGITAIVICAVFLVLVCSPLIGAAIRRAVGAPQRRYR